MDSLPLDLGEDSSGRSAIYFLNLDSLEGSEDSVQRMLEADSGRARREFLKGDL